MEPVKIQVVPAPWMVENALERAANFIEHRDKIPGIYRFDCIATGSINSGSKSYTEKLPLREFVRWEKDFLGKVSVYLAPVRRNETEIYVELAEPPALSGDQILEIQDAVDYVHTPQALVLSVLKCTEEELSSFLALSFHFNSNPLPAIRDRFSDVGIDVDIRADRCGDAVTIRFK